MIIDKCHLEMPAKVLGLWEIWGGVKRHSTQGEDQMEWLLILFGGFVDVDRGSCKLRWDGQSFSPPMQEDERFLRIKGRGLFFEFSNSAILQVTQDNRPDVNRDNGMVQNGW